MTMVWPDQKVALRIVDDPSGADFDPRDYPGYQVVETTCEQLDSYEGYTEVMERLESLVCPGRDMSYKTPAWRAQNRQLYEELKGVASPLDGVFF